ncbi:PREDICTED: cytosolic 5'-nucleotidase 1A-like [Gavialis gangeticus]|uniref:cytosolic 5'-nucleotidase 1A-like n=1 Tax=Gavialis gangeticus TaxID=94835 RepID=UPI00092F16CA|nr:PREDICTED: cytosolic 5'-nucleotidase 1A-like [Gavialis gangeticus]
MTADDDPEPYIEAFKCQAIVAGLDKRYWATQLGALVVGTAQAAYRSLNRDEAQDYGAVKTAILYRLELDSEHYWRLFRAKKGPEDRRPRGLLQQLRDLFGKWTDGSSVALGAVLTQQDAGEDQPMAYASQKLLPAETRPAARRRPQPKPQHAITVAVSSRALFDLVEERRIYEEQGVERYVRYQQDNENVTLKPGPAFNFVKALEHVNARLRELYPDDEELFDIVLMTNNHAQVGVRLINSINHYGLTIERFCMTGGKSPVGYLKAYLTNLYLSADSEKVQEAIEAGIASATMFSANKDVPFCDNQLRVAFDGDAVLFSDESEKIVKEQGLDRFFEHEQLNENKPLAQGPLKGFLEDLGKLQKKFYAKNERLDCPIRTYLVTARSAASSGARVLKTLRSWGLEIDEALFLAGAPKGPVLVKIRPHIFFDDQMFHIEGARQLGTIAAHVPYGIGQKYYKSKPNDGSVKK